MKRNVENLPEPAEEREGLLRAAYNPLEVIQGLIAITLIVFGLYLCSPFYVPQENTAAAAAFANSALQRVITSAIFFVAPAISTMIGFFSPVFRLPVWRARGCFLLAFGIFFLTFLRIVSVGLNPPIWAFYLALGLVCGVMYLYWRSRA